MSQKCSECGRESPFGQPFQHYWGCVHDTSSRMPLLSQAGRMHREYLNGPFNQQANSHGAGVSDV